MNQRIMIAMSIACNPRLLIADEPTTALDVTIQAQILDLIWLQRDRGMALVLITHDMGVVAETVPSACNRPCTPGSRSSTAECRRQTLCASGRDIPTRTRFAGRASRTQRRAATKLPTIPGIVPGAGDRPTGCLFQSPLPLSRHRPLSAGRSRRFAAMAVRGSVFAASIRSIGRQWWPVDDPALRRGRADEQRDAARGKGS